jgi:vacuolar-type H+-ATPase subunit H
MSKPLYVSLLLASLMANAAAAEQAATATPTATTAKAWSVYTPIAKLPSTPTVKQKAWVRTPIDAFVLAQLEAKQIQPASEADRGTFIRRATLDAWGILPTPEEVAAFVNDKAPNAHEKLVDRLLGSHHFGERQARRWLDLARYADSAGFQGDQTRPNNWRYRDYVINAFNSDKPFDRFIKEQIAGDELYPKSQEARIATGYIAGYPDNSNSRDLVQRHYQISTDITDLVGETLLGSTIGCARCHNHKADKVSQKEYFQLQAFFSNTVFDEKAKLEQKAEVDTAFEKAQASYREATKDIRDKQRAILKKYEEKATKYQKERYLGDSRDSLFKAKDQWNAMDKWVNWRHQAVYNFNQEGGTYLKMVAEDKNSPEFDEAALEDWKAYKQLTEDLKKLDHLKPKIAGSATLTAALEPGKDAPPTFVRFGGIHERPLEEVQPGIPALWNTAKEDVTITPTENSSGRRTALVNWLTSPNNPLTSRVYVNRIWSQYFDKGIVSTLGDFGRAGDKPTHPQLLDYLAGNFVANGWSVKKLHREILLSSVYRQSSAERKDVVKVDPDNKLLAVYPRKRLEAEEIRDSLLYASGQLVDKVGGPAVFPPVPNNLNAGNLWEAGKDPEDARRRSIYTFVRRSVPYPLTVSFDPANPVSPHQKRDVTTTPLQALALFNSDLVFAWSQALAGRVINEAGKDESVRSTASMRCCSPAKPARTRKPLWQPS